MNQPDAIFEAVLDVGAVSPTRRKRIPTPRSLLSFAADGDLEFIVNDAESALGVRSTEGAIVAMISTGGVSRGSRTKAVGYSDGVHDVEIEQTSAERRMLSEHQRRQTDRARRLRARWRALEPKHRDVLTEAHARRPLPRETDGPIGPLAGVALLTVTAREGLPAIVAVPGVTPGRGRIAGHPAETGRGEWLRDLCKKPGQNADIIAAIVKDARGMYAEALEAWRGTVGVEPASEVPRDAPPEREGEARPMAPAARQGVDGAAAHVCQRGPRQTSRDTYVGTVRRAMAAGIEASAFDGDHSAVTLAILDHPRALAGTLAILAADVAALYGDAAARRLERATTIDARGRVSWREGRCVACALSTMRDRPPTEGAEVTEGGNP